MARYQNGSVRSEQRSDGPTWVYRFQKRDPMERESNTRQYLVSCAISVRARRMRGRKWIGSVSGKTLTNISSSVGTQQLMGNSVSITFKTSCRKISQRQPSRWHTQLQRLTSGF